MKLVSSTNRPRTTSCAKSQTTTRRWSTSALKKRKQASKSQELVLTIFTVAPFPMALSYFSQTHQLCGVFHSLIMLPSTGLSMQDDLLIPLEVCLICQVLFTKRSRSSLPRGGKLIGALVNLGMYLSCFRCCI